MPDDYPRPDQPRSAETTELAGQQVADRPPAPEARVARYTDDLNRRMHRLAHGHPSSPYEADGTRKPSVISLGNITRAAETVDEHKPADQAEVRQAEASPTDIKARRDAADQADGADQTPAAEQAPAAKQTDAAGQTDSVGQANAADQTDAADPTHAADHTEAADWIRPLTDEEHAEHVADVRARLEKAHADGLATDQQYTIDPDKKEWATIRNRVQAEIISDLYERAADVPCERRAVIAGGLGGAGKTTVLDNHYGIDRSQYLTINPDQIKEEMASRGLTPRVNGLSPMEASDLAHEESSYIAKRLAMRATADGRNIIWDITMSSPATTERRIDELRAAGYVQIDAIFIDIPVETSVGRADGRHREGHDEYRKGNGPGGRFVPAEVIRAQADPQWGCQNRRTFEEIKHRLDSWSLYDNSVDGRSPELVETSATGDSYQQRSERDGQ